MPTANASVTVTISRPVTQVFSYMSDYNNNIRWQQGVVNSQQITSGDPGVGTKVSYTRQLAGQNIEATATMVDFEQNSKIRIESSSKIYQYHGGYDFISIDEETTEVRYQGAITTGRLLGLLGKKMAGAFEQQMTTDLNTLKRLFERGELDA